MRDIKKSADGDNSERSIRNIPLSQRRFARPLAVADHSDDLAADGPLRLPHRRSHRRGGRFWLWAGIVVVVFGIGGLLISTVFAGATVTVHPRVQTVTMPATLQAQANAPVGVLPYQIVSVTRSSSQKVSAQGTQKVSRPASGSITISNRYSSASQRLINNTRFEAPDGKIYRIRDSVTVPGMKGAAPGTATATVYADSPGADYNKSGGITLNIPGFKGDPRYGKFTAIADKGITGGFIGDEAAVAPADLTAAKTTLQKQLDTDVRSAAVQAIPEGFVAIPGSLDTHFSDITQSAGDNNTATLTESATATGIVVKVADLANAIAHKTVQGYVGEAVLFGDASQMSVTVASSTDRNNGGPITLNLAGSATLIWQFDPGALQKALAGKNKSEFEKIIQSFRPAVAKADASVRPFWQGTFPSDASKIKITVVVQ